jgi:hypothetical protein
MLSGLPSRSETNDEVRFSGGLDLQQNMQQKSVAPSAQSMAERLPMHSVACG